MSKFPKVTINNTVYIVLNHSSNGIIVKAFSKQSEAEKFCKNKKWLIWVSCPYLRSRKQE